MSDDEQLTAVLEIGNINVDLGSTPAEVVPPSLHPFLTADRRQGPSCALRLGPVPSPAGDALLFDSGGLWRVRTHEAGVRIDLQPRGRIYQSLLLDEELTRGEAVLDTSRIANDDPEACFALRAPMLELWISFLLMRGRGLLLHGLGVQGDDGVHVFAGSSGAGKSTLANLAVRVGAGRVLSDDRLIVRPVEGGFVAHGTPWNGEPQHALPASGRLVRVHFLEQAPADECLPLSSSEAARRLYGCCFVAGWPRSGLGYVLEQCARLASHLRCDVLRFTPESSALRVAGLHW